MTEIFSPAAVPPFYQGYVQRVKNLPLLEALSVATEQSLAVISAIPEEQGTFAYAPGKWTIKELLNHMLDAERVFAYRALVFARNDATALPGFDENAYVPQSNAHCRSIAEIGQAMKNLRLSTIDLFQSFTEQMLKRKGIANQTELSVEGIGYIIAGHELHHVAVLTERYLQ